MHAVTDENGRPIRFFMTAGEISDYTGAAAFYRRNGIWPTVAMTRIGFVNTNEWRLFVKEANTGHPISDDPI